MVEESGESSKVKQWCASKVVEFAGLSYIGYEAHGIGRKEIKRKRYLDEGNEN